MIPWLDHSLSFPDPNSALKEPDGLLAAGGDLSTDRLLQAYRQGIFPWYDDQQPILWWSPSARFVLYPDELSIPRSVRKQLAKLAFDIRFDDDFQQVIEYCGSLRADREGTWITGEMKLAYAQLHRLGHAHCVGSYREGRLVGGLYGVSLGRVFFGESMFSLEPGASRAAFIALVHHLKNQGFTMIDCQIHSDHLARLGAREIPRQRFLQQLAVAIQSSSIPGSWSQMDG